MLAPGYAGVNGVGASLQHEKRTDSLAYTSYFVHTSTRYAILSIELKIHVAQFSTAYMPDGVHRSRHRMCLRRENG